MEIICLKTGKTSYQSQAEASNARYRFEKRRKNKGKKLSVFQCLHCEGWHLGHRTIWRGEKKYG